MNPRLSHKFRILWHQLTLSGPVMWLIAANITMFLTVWAVILIGNACGVAGNFTMPWLGVAGDFNLFIRRPWTMLTYMVTQYDFLHLLFNLLWLYCFGIMMADTRRTLNILTLYIGGGIAGAIVYIAVTALSPTGEYAGSFLCGASAAVLSVMAATAILMPDRRVHLFLVGAVRLKWLAIIFFIIAFLGLENSGLPTQGAHIGGTLFGLGFTLISRLRSHHHKIEKSKKDLPSITEFEFKRKLRINVNRDGRAVAEAMANRLPDNERLDQLLDKIRLSGYPSLTVAERNELNLLSQRLDKDK